MKTTLLFPVLLLAMGAACAADPDPAPFINHQIKELTEKVTRDLAAGALSQADADLLKQEIAHVQSTEDNEPSLTGKTRRDMREQLSKIDKDLQRDEATAKAMAAASASPTP